MGEFEAMGFGGSESGEKDLQFDLTESTWMSRVARRTTLTWTDFSSAGFTCMDTQHDAPIQPAPYKSNIVLAGAANGYRPQGEEVATDDVDETKDRQIADHVLRMHRYLPPGVEEGTLIQDTLSQLLSVENPAASSNTNEAVKTSPFEKYDPLLHVGMTAGKHPKTRAGRAAKKVEVLSVVFIKKYIQYAKSKPAPVLTNGAADWIVGLYSELRNETAEDNRKKTSPLTARTLETLIRLAMAHAKARLSPVANTPHLPFIMPHCVVSKTSSKTCCKFDSHSVRILIWSWAQSDRDYY